MDEFVVIRDANGKLTPIRMVDLFDWVNSRDDFRYFGMSREVILELMEQYYLCGGKGNMTVDSVKEAFRLCKEVRSGVSKYGYN